MDECESMHGWPRFFDEVQYANEGTLFTGSVQAKQDARFKMLNNRIICCCDNSSNAYNGSQVSKFMNQHCFQGFIGCQVYCKNDTQLSRHVFVKCLHMILVSTRGGEIFRAFKIQDLGNNKNYEKFLNMNCAKVVLMLLMIEMRLLGQK
eukprot:TRINITY_DN35205_c0_g1_i1.p1 TRINITY_DN35205_c0_g1~~TRINITY_DN35205_c0_g1_i1.p1  ORF type:complete len:149 (+),score=1.80 TRINITY_DN35205_c0_g1_i1:308-754(+)